MNLILGILTMNLLIQKLNGFYDYGSSFSMNFLILGFVLVLLFVQNSVTIYAENTESNLENSSTPIEQFRSPSSSKIHPTLIQWQLSVTPNEFAKENNLSYNENKIGVYIYLDNFDSLSKIPSEIEVIASDEKIIVAFVSSEQLDTLEELDFVERVTPPDFARTPPIPQVEIPETQTIEENPYDYLVWVVVGGIVIIAAGIFKKRKKPKD